MEFFGLGLYQLESLIHARPQFRFFDVRVRPQILSLPQVQAVMSHAVPVASQELPSYLTNHKIVKDEPIILVCEDGRLSRSLATKLYQDGYHQIYVVDGGVDALLSEASLG